MIEWFEDDRVELFDLATDPGETIDLAGDRPNTVLRLRGALAGWRLGIGAEMPRANPDFKPKTSP